MAVVTQTQTAASGRRSTPARRRHRKRVLSRRDVVVASLMLGVPLLLDLAFVWLPALSSVALSFFTWSGIGSLHARACKKALVPGISDNGCFTGVKNYHQAASVDPDFWPAIQHNLIWLAVFVVIAAPLGMLFAVLVDRGLRGGRIYQSILYLPVMLSLALIGIIWEFMYSQNTGLINSLLGRTSNADAIDWLGNPHLNLWAILVEATWRQAGYVMVLYLAGLKSFDPSLREAALLDGASAWQTFWRVTFPVLRPINIVILVVTVIESLRAFDLVYITNKGSNGLQLLSSMVTNNIVGEIQRVGYGSALGVVLLVIALVPITIFLYQTFKKEEEPA